MEITTKVALVTVFCVAIIIAVATVCRIVTVDESRGTMQKGTVFNVVVVGAVGFAAAIYWPTPTWSTVIAKSYVLGLLILPLLAHTIRDGRRPRKIYPKVRLVVTVVANIAAIGCVLTAW